MGRTRVGVLAVLGATIAAAQMLACSVDSSGKAGQTADASLDAGTEPDVVDEQQEDAAEEVAVEEADVHEVQPPPSTCTAQSCGGACCGGRCVSQTCAGCDAGSHFCPFNPAVGLGSGSCVADCSECQPGGAP